MKAQISYFTGTGNSLRAADLCRQALEAAGYETALNEIRRGAAPVLDGVDLFGLCCPVYSLGAPRIVREFLQSLPAVPSPVRAFVLATAGDAQDVGWTMQEAATALGAKGFDVVVADAVEMPNNWLPMSYVPTAAEAAEILAAAESKISQTVAALLAGRRIVRPLDLGSMGRVRSAMLHGAFHRLGIRRLWFFFRTSDACTGCGQCARICPTQSISMVKSRPRWSRTCEQCLRCMHFCPSRAITQFELMGKGSARNRYHEPHFTPAGLEAPGV